MPAITKEMLERRIEILLADQYRGTDTYNGHFIAGQINLLIEMKNVVSVPKAYYKHTAWNIEACVSDTPPNAEGYDKWYEITGTPDNPQSIYDKPDYEG